jgi:excisionase family DNA binding protein
LEEVQMLANKRENPYLAPKQFAAEHGLHVSAIYRAVEKGELPAVRMGRRGAIRIPGTALKPEPRS